VTSRIFRPVHTGSEIYFASPKKEKNAEKDFKNQKYDVFLKKKANASHENGHMKSQKLLLVRAII